MLRYLSNSLTYLALPDYPARSALTLWTVQRRVHDESQEPKIQHKYSIPNSKENARNGMQRRENGRPLEGHAAVPTVSKTGRFAPVGSDPPVQTLAGIGAGPKLPQDQSMYSASEVSCLMCIRSTWSIPALISAQILLAPLIEP